jgi:DNA modification methylase
MVHCPSGNARNYPYPFLGSGTTAVAAKKLGRHFLGFEINPDYCKIAEDRIAVVQMQPTLFEKKPEQMELA